MIPPAFALNRAQEQKLALRCHQCVDALIKHEQNVEALQGVRSEILVALVLHKIAARRLKDHQVPPAQLEALLPDLHTAAAAVHGIGERYIATQRLGCDARQREGLLLLADITDALRASIPRRLWLMAYKEAYRK